MQTLRMIIEMRTYKIKAGRRGEFLKTFESKARPEHEKIGMKILGPFLSVENEDTFFWMRAFPDLRAANNCGTNSTKANFGRRNSKES